MLSKCAETRRYSFKLTLCFFAAPVAHRVSWCGHRVVESGTVQLYVFNASSIRREMRILMNRIFSE